MTVLPSLVSLEGIQKLRWWEFNITDVASAKQFVVTPNVHIAAAEATVSATNDILVGSDNLAVISKQLLVPTLKLLELAFKKGDFVKIAKLDALANVCVRLKGVRGPNGGSDFDEITPELFLGTKVKYAGISFDEAVKGGYEASHFEKMEEALNKLDLAATYMMVEATLLTNTPRNTLAARHDQNIIVYDQVEIRNLTGLMDQIAVLKTRNNIFLHLPKVIADQIDSEVEPTESSDSCSIHAGWFIVVSLSFGIRRIIKELFQ